MAGGVSLVLSAMATVTVDVPQVGARLPITLDGVGTPKAIAAIAKAAQRSATCKLHRCEPDPGPGSTGPPYALLQFTVDEPALKSHAHEGAAKIKRGSVCLIGTASDLFISLARRGEHDGWESGMTVLGNVAEVDLVPFEAKIMALPRHNFTHPDYGTVSACRRVANRLPRRSLLMPSTRAQQHSMVLAQCPCSTVSCPASSPARNSRPTTASTMYERTTGRRGSRHARTREHARVCSASTCARPICADVRAGERDGTRAARAGRGGARSWRHIFSRDRGEAAC